MVIKHAYNFISTLCKECYIQPMVVEKYLRKVYESTFKYQTKLWSRISIDKLLEIEIHVAFETDKSIKWSVNTLENYKYDMNDHV